jgi:hypothetical protein
MIVQNVNKGFTLLEVLIYITLFTFIIGGALLTTYQILDSSSDLQSKNTIDEEANFLLRKLDWATNGVSSVSAFGSDLVVIKEVETLTFDLDSGNLRLNGIILNSENVIISNVVFSYIPSDNNKISIVFEVDGREFSTIKHIK